MNGLRILTAGLTILLLASCYKDKGNYSYHDLNEISIQLPEEVAVQQGRVLEIEPQLTFSNGVEEDNLAFQWVISIATGTDSTDVVLSKERNFSEQINYTSGNTYKFNFKVTNLNNGITYRKPMLLKVQTAYQPGFFLLEENGTQGDISFANTTSDSVYHHLFSTVNPEFTLPPTVTDLYCIDVRAYSYSFGDDRIQVPSSNLSMVFYEDGGYVFDYRSGKVITPLEQMFSNPPKRMRPSHLCMDKSPNFLLINDGKAHRMFQDKGQTLFGENLIIPGNRDYELAPVIASVYNGYSRRFFDVLNHRFWAEGMSSLTLDSSKHEINPGWEFITMQVGGVYRTNTFVLFKDQQEQSYILHFDVGNFLRLTDTIRNNPALINSPAYAAPVNRDQLYYASRNAIWLHDVMANISRMVYECPANETITTFTLVSSGLEIAIATHDGSTGTLYTVPLSGTGEALDGKYSKRYTGFDRIKKITHRP